VPDRATGRAWPRSVGIGYALAAGSVMLTVGVVLLVLQRAPGVAWPVLVCGLALLANAIGTREREDR
jgi:hypothetical protein